MRPVIAIVGRPNVGKSTLFNQLTRSRDALVADVPGLTRDRKYGEGSMGDRPYILIDTGGLGEEEVAVDNLMAQQSVQAAHEADAILFLVDGRAGCVSGDLAIAQQLRELGKPITLCVNKTDGLDPDIALSDFYQLGINDMVPIAAAHRRNVSQLIESVLAQFPESDVDEVETPQGTRIAIVGRPNVGKSTLVNRMLGEERVIVYDMPGTTRDSIFIPMERQGENFVLIDTAGVRRRGRVHETVEKFSVIKTLQAIEEANVVIMVLDAQDGISEQDMHLLGFIIDAGRALVMAVNKWDGLSQETKDAFKSELSRRLGFTDFAEVYYISALHGTNVGHLFEAVQTAHASATKDVPTSQLTRILEDAQQAHQPPLVRGRRIKLRYAHLGGHNPPIIVIHGNQTARLPASYKRYLMNTFRKALQLIGTPVRIECRSSDNPYAGRRNKLTPRQEAKKRRMLKHVKKKKKD